MPEYQPTEAILLALGNPQCGDDQFGSLLLERFANAYRLPPQLRILHGGIRPLALYPSLIGCPWLILLDAVLDDPPARSAAAPHPVVLDPLPPLTGSQPLAVHQIGIQELLQLMAVLGEAPAHVSLIGLPLQALTPGSAPSTAVHRQLPQACQALETLLQRHGIAVRPRTSLH